MTDPLSALLASPQFMGDESRGIKGMKSPSDIRKAVAERGFVVGDEVRVDFQPPYVGACHGANGLWGFRLDHRGNLIPRGIRENIAPKGVSTL